MAIVGTWGMCECKVYSSPPDWFMNIAIDMGLKARAMEQVPIQRLMGYHYVVCTGRKEKLYELRDLIIENDYDVEFEYLDKYEIEL